MGTKPAKVKEAKPTDIGGVARYYGLLPRYLKGGYWNPSKKRTRRRS